MADVQTGRRVAPCRHDRIVYPDPRLPATDQARLEDYSRSGFNRGHMTSARDMPDWQAQQQSIGRIGLATNMRSRLHGWRAERDVEILKTLRVGVPPNPNSDAA
jgi:endonuclease G